MTEKYSVYWLSANGLISGHGTLISKEAARAALRTGNRNDSTIRYWMTAESKQNLPMRPPPMEDEKPTMSTKEQLAREQLKVKLMDVYNVHKDKNIFLRNKVNTGIWHVEGLVSQLTYKQVKKYLKKDIIFKDGYFYLTGRIGPF